MKKQKFVQWSLIALVMLTLAAFMLLPQIYQDNVLAQATYQTPTPGTDGRILYTVQEGDTCTRIFLLTGVEISQLISLNSLDAACTIYPGDSLVLGIVDVQLQTDTPESTAMPVDETPLPTASPGYAEVCIVLFDDADGNGMLIEPEFFLEGGAVSINNRSGTVSLTGLTVGGDPELVAPLCFEEVPEGEYNITLAVPEGFNATTMTNYALTINAGDNVTIDFGAQTSENVSPSGNNNGSGRSPILGIAGGLILVGGLGLGIYMWRARKS